MILGICFIPLPVMAGLSGLHLHHRQRCLKTLLYVSPRKLLGLIAGSLVGLIEAKQREHILSVLLGVVGAFPYQRIVDTDSELAFERDVNDQDRRAALTLACWFERTNAVVYVPEKRGCDFQRRCFSSV